MPTTAQALAYVAAEHAGTPSSASGESDAADEFGSHAVGTELRFGPDGESDGDALVVAVGRELDLTVGDCGADANAHLAGCVETERGVLMWEEVAPESDPAVVYCWSRRATSVRCCSMPDRRSRATPASWTFPSLAGRAELKPHLFSEVTDRHVCVCASGADLGVDRAESKGRHQIRR